MGEDQDNLAPETSESSDKLPEESSRLLEEEHTRSDEEVHLNVLAKDTTPLEVEESPEAERRPEATEAGGDPPPPPSLSLKQTSAVITWEVPKYLQYHQAVVPALHIKTTSHDTNRSVSAHMLRS